MEQWQSNVLEALEAFNDSFIRLYSSVRSYLGKRMPDEASAKYLSGTRELKIFKDRIDNGILDDEEIDRLFRRTDEFHFYTRYFTFDKGPSGLRRLFSRDGHREDISHALTQISVQGAILKDRLSLARRDLGLRHNIISTEVSDLGHPPAPPGTSTGPRFLVSDGKIIVDESLEAHEVNARVSSIAPVLRQQVDDAIVLFARNIAYPTVASTLRSYRVALEGENETLNFELIATYGIILANAEVAAARSIADRLLPEFEDIELAALRSILDLHGPFVLASPVGRGFIEELAAYQRSPDEISRLKEAAQAITNGLVEQGIVNAPAATLLTDVAENIGEGKQPLRSAELGAKILRNVTVPAIAGAAAYALFSAGILTGTSFWWIATVISAEGIKRSPAGVAASEIVRDAIADPTQAANFRKLAAFVVRYETQFRILAEQRREFEWINKWLDYLKKLS